MQPGTLKGVSKSTCNFIGLSQWTKLRGNTVLARPRQLLIKLAYLFINYVCIYLEVDMGVSVLLVLGYESFLYDL